MPDLLRRLGRRRILPAGGMLLCLALLFGTVACPGHSQEPVKKAPLGAPSLPDGVKVVVENSAAVEYLAEPVTVGVPLPREANIATTANLALTRNGGAIPCQMKILSRWGQLTDSQAPIRWVLLDFQATVPARTRATYLLVLTAKPAAAPVGIVTKESGAGVAVATGPLSFVVPKDGFSFLRRLVVDGVVRNDLPGGGIVIEKGDAVYSSALDRPQVVIEEPGPLRTTIRVKGKFRRTDGTLLVGGDARWYLPEKKITPKAEEYPLSYTFRITAFSGKSFVRCEVTLENNGNTLAFYYPINDLFLDGVSLKIPVGAGPVTARGAGFTNPVGAGDRFLLWQGYTDRDTKGSDEGNFDYRAMVNSKEVADGRRYPGYLDVTGTQGGMLLAVPRFWQNAPKSLAWRDGLLLLGILPAERTVKETTGPFVHYTQGNYFFSGGWHKTTELFLTYHGKEFGTAELARGEARSETPLTARCEPAWYARCGAFGTIAPDLTEAAGMENGEAIDVYEKFQKMLVDGQYEQKGRDLVTLRETRALNRSHYGWEHFGDLAYGGGYSSLHYDWPYIMWLQYLRSGDRRFRDRAVEMTEHSADLDQIHTDSPGNRYDGIWQWEDVGGKFVNNHHKSTQGAGAALSHTWNGGYALGYLLTGNDRYREAAERSAEAGRRRWQKAIAGQKEEDNQSRTQGWGIQMLINLYRITGDPKLLHDALAIFRNSLLYTEQMSKSPGSGGKGYVTSTGGFKKEYVGKVIVTMATYPLDPVCDLHQEATAAGLKADDVEAYLLRSLAWLKEYAYVGGKTDFLGNRSLLTLSYATDPVNPDNNQGGELVHNINVVGAYAYASRMLRDRAPARSADYLNFARQLFRDQMFHMYEQKRTKTDYYSSRSRSPVGWAWLPTGGKVIGYLGRGGQQYLFTEYELARKVPESPNSAPKQQGK